ncbi:hypothetical protein BGW42_002427 [Actinomortierella wolfii]|nr:hypothetical protein BGW42_002427 [Actinomortierella wolfii]KAG0242151.1 hypothetical protein BGW41_004774 [Actinomortierella wolfii]
MSRNTLFVSGFSTRTRARDLAYEFERYGPLVRCDIPALRNDSSRPYAFVEFEDDRDARDAYNEMRDVRFEGYRLNVQYAKNAPSASWRYERGGGRGRSRSPRRGRSPLRRHSPRRRSPSPVRRRSRSPRGRSPSPRGRRPQRSPSPAGADRRRSASRSPVRDRDVSPARRRSRSPDGVNTEASAQNANGDDRRRDSRSRSPRPRSISPRPRSITPQ